jgi:hypothetical protein
LHKEAKRIPPEVLGYCLAVASPDLTRGDGHGDITILQAARVPGGPGSVFALTNEALFEVASRAEQEASNGDIQISGLAGSRVIRVANMSPFDWIETYYRSRGGEYAA